jgi:biotin transport system permease protein
VTADPIRFRPAATLARRLDPRTKLAVQAAFVAAAFARTDPAGLAVLALLALAIARTARLSPLRTLWASRALAPFLVAGPVLSAATLGPPWIDPGEAVAPALASGRVVLVLLVAGAYVRSTPVRETRAAVQWLLPGRLGTAAGTGLGLVVRFLPRVRADLRTARAAADARLAARRPLRERMRLVATAGLRRAFGRADAVSAAMRARCFSWNPTLPELGLSRADLPGLALAGALAAVWLAETFGVA